MAVIGDFHVFQWDSKDRRKYWIIFLTIIIIIAVDIYATSCYMHTNDSELGSQLNIDKKGVFTTRDGIEGINFNMSLNLLHTMGLSHMNFDNRISDMERAQTFVFVTYANDKYFPVLKLAVDSIQKVHPSRKIVIYNLGLSAKHTHEVKSWCNVIFRQFEFDKYPKHVKDLHTYAFKALIWREVLVEFQAMFFIDATIVMSKFNIDYVIEASVKAGGFLMFSPAGHSNYAVTHPQMYQYFPVSVKAHKTIEQFESEAFVIHNNLTYWKILHWACMCSLDPDCISPKGSTRFCRFADDRYKTFAHCHRYDQSVLNLLAVNAFGYNSSSWIFSNDNERVFAVRRMAKRKPELYNVNIC